VLLLLPKHGGSLPLKLLLDKSLKESEVRSQITFGISPLNLLFETLYSLIAGGGIGRDPWNLFELRSSERRLFHRRNSKDCSKPVRRLPARDRASRVMVLMFINHLVCVPQVCYLQFLKSPAGFDHVRNREVHLNCIPLNLRVEVLAEER
jgi:hypothetical protein